MADEQAFLAPASALLAGRPIASPFQFLFTGEDNLRVVILNSQAGTTVTLDGRYLPVGGTPQAFTQAFKPTADRTPNTFDFGFGDGYLLNASVIVTGGSPLVGQTYVMVQIIRGLGGATTVLGCLLAGYVTAMQHVAYPGSPIESSTAGEPFVRTIVGTSPVAGGEISETVPAGARWELLTINVELVDSGQVATRRPRLVVRANGTQTTGLFPLFTTMAASDDFGFCLAPTLPAGNDGAGNFTVPFPNGLIVQAGGIISTSTGGLQTLDRWAAPVIQAREWLEAA